MPPRQVSVTCNKINALSSERTESNDLVKRGWVCMHFSIVDLTIVTFSNRSYIVFEHRRPEIPHAQNILSNGKP